MCGKIAYFHKHGGLPYAYDVYKNKDVTRLRTIVSCDDHPLRNVFHNAQRALLFMVKVMKVEHFTLHTTQDYVPTASLKNCRVLQSSYGSDTMFMEFSKEELANKLELDFKCEVFGLRK